MTQHLNCHLWLTKHLISSRSTFWTCYQHLILLLEQNASMFSYLRPTLLINIFAWYIFDGKQLSLGNKCLRSRASNSLKLLLETPWTWHTFINNIVTWTWHTFINNIVAASLVEWAPWYNTCHASCNASTSTNIMSSYVIDAFYYFNHSSSITISLPTTFSYVGMFLGKLANSSIT